MPLSVYHDLSRPTPIILCDLVQFFFYYCSEFEHLKLKLKFNLRLSKSPRAGGGEGGKEILSYGLLF